jgi:orotate phosphoribosyltransferase-like protein
MRIAEKRAKDAAVRRKNVALLRNRIKRMKDKGLSNAEIAKEIGMPESSVRILTKESL